MSDLAAPVPTLAIVGPTASGKSALAMALAARLEQLGSAVELISVDSMQVYRGMDIGTAKPTVDERRAVRHHLIDVLDPEEECSASWFQEAGRAARADLRSRGVSAILVGGTGLYHRAVVDDLEIPGRYPAVVAELDREPDSSVLHRRLAELDPTAAARMEPANRRRIVRALEVTIGAGRPFSSYGPGLESYAPNDVVQVGLRVDRAGLEERLRRRLDLQMQQGFLGEVERLEARPAGWSRTAAQALGYRELRDHLAGRVELADALSTVVSRTRQFAVRQDRWFRRDPRVTWFDADATDLVDRVWAHAQSKAATTPDVATVSTCT